MMAISHLLEEFNVSTAANERLKQMSEDDQEDLRLASFEQGYTAGWDDAIHAQAEDQSRITGELARALEDLSFTFQEALVQMMSSIEPIFTSLVETVLPEAMSQTVGLRLAEQCCEMVRNQVEQPVSLVVPVGSGSAIQSILGQRLAMPVEVVESADVGPGQACLKVGHRECEIDNDVLLSELRSSINAFFYQTEKASLHG